MTEYERQVLLSRNTSCQVIYKIYFRDFKLASLGSELYNSKTEESEHADLLQNRRSFRYIFFPNSI